MLNKIQAFISEDHLIEIWNKEGRKTLIHRCRRRAYVCSVKGKMGKFFDTAIFSKVSSKTFSSNTWCAKLQWWLIWNNLLPLVEIKIHNLLLRRNNEQQTLPLPLRNNVEWKSMWGFLNSQPTLKIVAFIVWPIALLLLSTRVEFKFNWTMILQIFRQWWVGGSGKVSECCQHVSNLMLTSAVITGSEALPVRFYRLILYIILGVKYCSPIFLFPVRFSFRKAQWQKLPSLYCMLDVTFPFISFSNHILANVAKRRNIRNFYPLF